MKIIFHKVSQISQGYMIFFLFAVLVLWMKTYLVQLTQFNLGVEGPFQQIILFLNPLGSSLFFLSWSFFLKDRNKKIGLLTIYFLLSVLIYSNVLYYRFFYDFITLPTLYQVQNFGEVSSSIGSLVRPYDFFFFIDFVSLVLILIFAPMGQKWSDSYQKRPAFLFFSLGISFANLVLAELDRPELLTRGFDRNYIVKYLGIFNYIIYDAVQSTKTSAQRVMADSSDVIEALNYTNSHYAKPNPVYFGAGKGFNVIYFHLESMQSFLINYRLHGKEVTPFLNSMTRDQHTVFFDNFFHQTAHGKTSDAEFMIENSLFGLPQGSAFITKGLNTYQAAPAILGQLGYTSAVFHGNSGSFWNRDEIYKSFGYDHFFDSSYYKMLPDNLTEYGLMDKPFFEESIPLLESLPEPFYAKFITVTNHFPYPITRALATIEPNTTGIPSVDSYFQTARYADEALKQMFTYLKKSGLYDRSIIIMYGDHYGISKDYDNAVGQVLGKTITPFESEGLQRVPLFIRVPQMKGGINHEYAGQIDLLPTLLHLLGINTKQYVQFGTDLFSKEHDDLVPFRNGDFVSPRITSVNGRFYDSTTGLSLGQENYIEANNALSRVHQKLYLSDHVVNKDLLRFYTPKNFIPVNRLKYYYHKSQRQY